MFNVIEQIKQGASQFIQDCRDYSDELNTHYTGIDSENMIEEILGYQSESQKKLRNKLKKSNKSFFAFLTRPLDKVFTAKGGVINYNLSESKKDKLRNFIEDINDGLDIKTFNRKKVKDIYIIDPNAFIFLDINAEGEITTNIYKTSDVLHYENRGNNLELVIFNPYESEDENDKKKYYRVVDAETDSIYIQEGDDVWQDEDTILPNFFEYVPGRILGDIFCPNTDKFLSFLPLSHVYERLVSYFLCTYIGFRYFFREW